MTYSNSTGARRVDTYNTDLLVAVGAFVGGRAWMEHDPSALSAQAYAKVYEADRPEIFFKSLPEKVVATGEAVGIRKDAKWNVPEPELALVINSKGRIVGYTIGNDMSSRDIEGENPLYLPQAKVYDRSAAVVRARKSAVSIADSASVLRAAACAPVSEATCAELSATA